MPYIASSSESIGSGRYAGEEVVVMTRREIRKAMRHET